MLGPLSTTIQGVINFTWPMIIISMVIIISFRITYLIKNKQRLILYKELPMLICIVYILCLFQVVTFQDDVSWASNNFIPLKEILNQAKVAPTIATNNVAMAITDKNIV